ncbi:MAG TPA: ATP-binding cassette domain-containing protein [Caulobacteraceae bacterium]|nr:ATP-binding cassette domain-containing protein [Caulobacteraceae bacterium]
MAPTTPPPLEVRNLRKRFASGRGLEAISLTAPAGAITGFIGPNGAGKSTTARCVLGLLAPDSGDIRLFGAPPTPRARARIGFIPEERGLFAGERARAAVAFHGRLKGLSRREAMRRADALFERLGLGACRAARIGELSKGNAQKAQIACALVHDPELLILDEPLSGLDPIGQSEVIGVLAERARAGAAILLSTHAMAAAEAFCDRVVIVHAGRTVFEGAVAEAAARAAAGAIVATTDVGALAAAAVDLDAALVPAGPGRWRVSLPAELTHPALLRALARRGVAISAFEPIRADLAGAFWTLTAQEDGAGADARRAA